MNQTPPEALLFTLHKPAGPTSFDVVHAVKKILGKQHARKIGHFGTLDPFANGFMIVGTSGATRLADRVHEEFPKTYHAHGKLGIQMDTGDITGDQVAKADIVTHDLKVWQEAAAKMLGEYWQRPPAYSATKHEGKALYEYARRGIMIEKDAVKRFIHKFEVVAVDGDKVEFIATVSGGTYIRTLFEDLAKACDNLGHLLKLERSHIGELECPKEHGSLKELNADLLSQLWLPIDELLPRAHIILEGRDLELFSHGQHLTRPRFSEFTGEVWVCRPQGDILALGEIHDNVLKCAVMFPGGSPTRQSKSAGN